MKKLTFCFAIFLVLLAGCRQDNKEFKTHTLSEEKCWLQIFDEPYVFDLDTIGVKMTYSLQWPDKGAISPSAERELMFLCFGDSNKVNVESALQGWIVEDVNDLQPVESFNEEQGYSYLDIRVACQKDSTLATFIIQTEGFPLGAAHGMHSTDFLTVDLETRNAIHLADLVTDTNLFAQLHRRQRPQRHHCLLRPLRDNPLLLWYPGSRAPHLLALQARGTHPLCQASFRPRKLYQRLTQ